MQARQTPVVTVPNLSQEQLKKLADRGPGAPMVSSMSGATSSDLYLLEYADRREVLRVFLAERWEAATADLSARELRILEALSATELPAPRPEGAFEANGVIMSWLPGRVVLPARPDAAWLDTLATMLADIHRSGIDVPFAYESWNDTRPDERPDWWQDQALWQEAQAASRERPAFEPRFIHRDYHPVNVLWEGPVISGVVDWINGCMGPVGIDVSHCRLNLAVMYGQDAADAFLLAYSRAMPGYQHDYFWDLDDALGALPDVQPYAPWADFGLTGLTTELVRERLLGMIAAALQNSG